ncbi:uncharacterized protein LOC108115104 [Drosophila eugracilis]|uniref:uncharacterized protein LOC108115104 n=1 Tax=Drosophila eugracilis TaxID=29029 RepID=UPI001BDA4239|nr:uncharacterized protein LOC108115104 [Drosophila eugracilis]
MSDSSLKPIKRNTSFGDVLRGKKIPVSRPSQTSLAKAEVRSKKVEDFIAKGRTNSLNSLLSNKSNRLTELDEWCRPRRRFHDEADLSLNPSYQIKNFQYNLNCLVRYMDTKEEYDRQFLQEMEHLIANQRNTCDQYFVRKMLCYKTLWPPLHTKQELKSLCLEILSNDTKGKASC